MPKNDDSLNAINEHTWDSWNHFFRGTNAALNGHEQCDCYRNQSLGPAEAPRSWVENRYYHHHDITVVFLSFLRDPGIMSMKGHVEFPYRGTDPPCPPGDCPPPVDWHHSLPAALKYIVTPFRPDLLVLNGGAWGSSNEWDETDFQKVFSTGKAALRRGGAAFWKTTSRMKVESSGRGRSWDEKAVRAAVEAGWGIYDTYGLTAKLDPESYWDDYHFHAYVYRELNLVMLNLFAAFKA